MSSQAAGGSSTWCICIRTWLLCAKSTSNSRCPLSGFNVVSLSLWPYYHGFHFVKKNGVKCPPRLLSRLHARTMCGKLICCPAHQPRASYRGRDRCGYTLLPSRRSDWREHKGTGDPSSCLGPMNVTLAPLLHLCGGEW